MNKVTVIGSLNVDTTIKVKAMPKPGETLHAKEVFNAGGGKGANQAIAAARSGADTHFIGALGNDSNGQYMQELMRKDSANISPIAIKSKERTGEAYIVVDEAGENSIMVYAGANMALTPQDVQVSEQVIKASDWVISQFESTTTATEKGFELAKQHGVKTILNPAPALENISADLLAKTDVLIPNETETEIITGIKISDEASLKQATDKLHQLGVEAIIITLGSKGAYYDVLGQSGLVDAFKVKAVDTTGAGDTFIGALSSVLKTDFSNIEEAIRYGNKASSLAVQQFGAQPSIPYKEQLN